MEELDLGTGVAVDLAVQIDLLKRRAGPFSVHTFSSLCGRRRFVQIGGFHLPRATLLPWLHLQTVFDYRQVPGGCHSADSQGYRSRVSQAAAVPVNDDHCRTGSGGTAGTTLRNVQLSLFIFNNMVVIVSESFDRNRLPAAGFNTVKSFPTGRGTNFKEEAS